MQLSAIRAHPWIKAEIERLQQPAATSASPPLVPPPQTARPSSSDLELLGVLAFLPLCVSVVAAQDGAPPALCAGDLVLHVQPEVPGEPPHLFTLRLDDQHDAFVLEGRQETTPLATFACRREQLLRWVAGASPLVPSAFELPPDSRLAAFLRNFSPNSQRFRAFCVEKGVAPSKSLRRQPRLQCSVATGRAGKQDRAIVYDTNAYTHRGHEQAALQSV